VKHLFSALADWIEDKVRDRKLRWLIAVPSGVATVLAIIGIAAAIQPLANVSLLVLSIFLFIVVITLGVNRRYMRRELGRTGRVLQTYGERVRRTQETNRDLFHTVRWSESVAVADKGNTTIVRDISVRIGAQPVAAIWSLSSRNSAAHLSPSIRDKVRVDACYLEDDGAEGTSIVTTHSWEGESRLRVYIYFDRDVAAGETIRIRLVIRWPKYSADILDGNAEVNSWVFRRPTDSFESTVSFSRSFSGKPLRVTTLNGSPAPEVSIDNASGQTKVHLNLTQIEVDREYGYRVDLRPDDRS